MKKLLMFAAIVIAVASCAGADVEELTPTLDDSYTSSVGELTEIFGDDLTIEVGLNGDDETTRIATDGDTWVTTWEEGDSLIAYFAEDGATFSKNTKFYMIEYGANASSFTGTHYEDYNRRIIYYPELAFGDILSEDTHYTWINGDMYAYTNFSSQSEGLDCNYMVDNELVSSEGSTVSPAMRHVGAAADLHVSFENFDDEADAYTLTRLSLNNIPTYAAIDLTLGVEDDGFYKEVTKGSIFVDVEDRAVLDSAQESIKFNILPFDIAAGESISLTFYFENEAGASYFATTDVTNTSGRSVSFARATYNTIYCSCDAKELISNSVEVTLGALSANNIPELDTWIITDTSAATTSFVGLNAAIEALNDTGRQISLEFPNLQTIPAFAIFGKTSTSSDFGFDALVSVKADVATSIGDDAFYSCSNLTSVELPEATSIGDHAFKECSNLTSVKLPKAVSIGERAFSSCTSLTEFDIAPTVTEISIGAFSLCGNLTVFNIDGDNFIFEDGILYSSSKNEVITALSTVISGDIVLDSSVISIEGYAFLNCNLTSIYAPEATSIGEWAFNFCSSLTSVELPEASSIGDYALGWCSNLTSVELPEATSIGSYAFEWCSNLTSVDLPEATSIGNYAFDWCLALTDVSMATNSGVKLESISSTAFEYVTTTNTDLTLGSDNQEYVDGSTLTIGDFSKEFKSITIVDGSDDAGYQAWLGTWDMTSTSLTVSGTPFTMEITITESETANQFDIYGFDLSVLRNAFALPAVYDATTGGWTVAPSNDVGTFNTGNTIYTMMYYAYCLMGSNYYIVPTGGFDALTATMGSDGSATIACASGVFDDGSTYSVATVRLYACLNGTYNTFYIDTSKLAVDSSDILVGPFTLTKTSSDISASAANLVSSTTTSSPQIRTDAVMIR